ncbi:ribonuclease T2 [Methylosinus sp. H3A]|uniref:ribonuclease T2 family protein n=1 Tax=Methylosinus sp. H3A TaxID=2785786 RepID=UPI0018C20AA6|nr:ribonuclease T2 [Methylosinus sp. H3A]MBG0811382.1 ribonuclease T2 [Methylosinus sp. H3A]
MFVQWSLVCAVAALVSLFTPAGVMAQSELETRGGAGGFDFYVLTLSWSPAFCESGGGREYRAQCEPGLGKGFVTHGLWPQYEHGFPSDCDGAATPSRMALEHVAGVYPDEGLARYEWRKHGRCSGKSPTDYFADVRRATESVTIPRLFERPREAQSFAPLDIQRAFIAANPRLRPGMLAVTCRKGALQDVRVCFSRDLREFRPCPEIVRGACRAGEISVPAPL